MLHPDFDALALRMLHESTRMVPSGIAHTGTPVGEPPGGPPGLPGIILDDVEM